MQQPAMPRRRTALEEEFDLMKQVQENRMCFREGMICHDRCAKHVFFNKLYGSENTCLRNCLEQLNQVTIITNVVHGQFEAKRHQKKG